MNQKDTIPRLNDIQYLLEGLKILLEGATFDKVRKAIISISKNRTYRDDSITRTGYSAAKRLRVVDDFTYWANAKDVLSELMRLKLAKDTVVPRKRKYVEIYRNAKYELTDQGEVLAHVLLKGDLKETVQAKDQIFNRMYQIHPYLRAFIRKLQQGPMFIPVYRLSTRFERSFIVEKAAILQDSTKWLVTEGRKLGLSVNVHKFEEQVASRIQMKSDASSLVDLINQHGQQAFVEAYGLHFGNITFEHLFRICRQFLIANFTYHVPAHPGLTLYSTAQIIENDPVEILRHRISDYEKRVIEEIPQSFTEFRKPFVPIHELRAIVCFKLAINDEIFDYVLKGLAEGKYQPKYKVSILRDVHGVLPPSANPLTIGNEHYYTLAILQEGL